MSDYKESSDCCKGFLKAGGIFLVGGGLPVLKEAALIYASIREQLAPFFLSSGKCGKVM